MKKFIQESLEAKLETPLRYEKEFAKDLKEMYTSSNEEIGYLVLEELKKKMGKKIFLCTKKLRK